MNLKGTMIMTNTITESAPEITPSVPEMDTWDMACAVLTALNQTHLKAMSEYVTLVDAANGNPFGPGVGNAGHLIETLKPALRQLEADMRKHARSDGVTMPVLER
jgi:hypothetical protein